MSEQSSIGTRTGLAFADRIKAHRSEERSAVSGAVAAIQQVYIPTGNDTLLNGELTRLFDSIVRELEWQAEHENTSALRGGRVLIVSGDPGAGKTRALSELFRSRPELEGFGETGAGCSLLSVVAPSPFTLGALGNEIVRKLGYYPRREIKQSEVWPMVKKMFAEHGVRILHIDEAQHGDQVNWSAAKEIENTLKGLLQDPTWTIWLILSGLPELGRFCQEDGSVLRRTSHVRFAGVSIDDDIEPMREAFRTLMKPCASVSFEDTLTDEFMMRLIHASGGQFGILIELIHEAIEACLLKGDAELSESHFSDAYAARTGNENDETNIFVADKYDEIDISTSLWEPPVSAQIAPSAAKIRRAKRKDAAKKKAAEKQS